jgi:hypothetical protein
MYQVIGEVKVGTVEAVASYKYVPVAPVVTFPAWSAMRNLINIFPIIFNPVFSQYQVAIQVEYIHEYIALFRDNPVVYSHVLPDIFAYQESYTLVLIVIIHL